MDYNVQNSKLNLSSYAYHSEFQSVLQEALKLFIIQCSK